MPRPVIERAGGTELPRGTEAVLLVEDELAVRTLVRRLLVRQGYQVLEAACAHEALAVGRVYEAALHLLLTDCLMPGITGVALADQMAILRPETRVLFMSGYTDDAALRKGLLRPGVAFLQKPFTPLGLAVAVRSVLDGVTEAETDSAGHAGAGLHG